MTVWRSHPLLSRLVILAVLGAGSPVLAQQAESSKPVSEDTEPRVIGRKGTLLIGLGGSVDRLFTAEDETSFHVTAQGDVGWFLTSHIVVEGGVSGSGSFGGDTSDDPAGPGTASLHAFGGALWYFTPDSLASLYVGPEYWAQLTRRDGPDAGAVLAKVGLQGALSSRTSVFVEGGYGVGLTRNDEGLPTTMVGRVGFRVKW